MGDYLLGRKKNIVEKIPVQLWAIKKTNILLVKEKFPSLKQITTKTKLLLSDKTVCENIPVKLFDTKGEKYRKKNEKIKNYYQKGRHFHY